MTDLARRDAQTAIELAKTPAEVNTIRSWIAAVQRAMGYRVQSFQQAHKGGRLYVEACAKAGEVWSKERPGQGARNLPQEVGKLIQEAGFKNEADATRCVRVSELDAEDRRTYYEECAQNGTIPSLNGAYGVWKEYFGEDGVAADWEKWLKTAINACKRIVESDAPADVRAAAEGFVRRVDG